MLAFIYPAIVIGLLILISLIHIYWAFGGQWGIARALPKINGQPAVRPPVWVTLLVAVFLWLSAVCVLVLMAPNAVLSRYIVDVIPILWVKRVGFGFGIAFLIRGMAGFILIRGCGYLRTTDFGRMDTMLYSPLCLFLCGAFFCVMNE